MNIISDFIQRVKQEAVARGGPNAMARATAEAEIVVRSPDGKIKTIKRAKKRILDF